MCWVKMPYILSHTWGCYPRILSHGMQHPQLRHWEFHDFLAIWLVVSNGAHLGVFYQPVKKYFFTWSKLWLELNNKKFSLGRTHFMKSLWSQFAPLLELNEKSYKFRKSWGFWKHNRNSSNSEAVISTKNIPSLEIDENFKNNAWFKNKLFYRVKKL